MALAAASFSNALADVAASVSPYLQTPPFPVTIAEPFLEAGVLAYPRRPGKMLRAALVQWCCGAVGGQPAQVRQVAAAIEIFHGWTLVHDDIIDADAQRRGGPTVHVLIAQQARERFPGLPAARAARFGEHQAILAGDVQQAWANALLLGARTDGLAPDLVLALLERLNTRINPELIAGEAQDVAFELRPPEDLGTAEILRMLELKTGVLLRFAAEAGALAGLGRVAWQDPALVALGEFAAAAGLAFQLRDDWLGIYGDPQRLGKPVGSDLRQGKRTLLLAEGLVRLPPAERVRLLALLGQPDAGADELVLAQRLLRDCGAEQAVLARADALLAQASTRLAELPASPWRDLLSAWLDFLAQRQS